MSRIRPIYVAGAALIAALPACDDDNPTNTATTFTANLTGGEEVPPVTTTATGTATFTIVGNQIQFTVNVAGIENVLFAHIHVAPAGQNGTIRLNLCGTPDPDPTPPCTSGTGVLISGTKGNTVGDPPITFDQLVEEMRAGNTYTNVHTTANPAGEIRGQIDPQ
jgi:CHRD domain